MSEESEEIVVEARGMACPLPIFELAKAARRAPPGAVLHLIGSDPAIVPDVTAWCEAVGYALLRLEQAEGRYEAWVRRIR